MPKRLLDITLSALALLLLSPLLLLLCLLVPLSSPGPIFFCQKRIGKNMQPFTCYKFRTMHQGAEKRLQSLLQTPQYADEWKRYHKLKKDPRLTPIGHVLRKYSLDELPQFFNILKGELSLVGPRAFAEKLDDPLFLQKLPVITTIKPGLTGLWQTSGRSNLTLQERLALEEQYVKTQNFKTDLKLLLKTIPAIVSATGSH